MSSQDWNRTVTCANHLSSACSHIRPSSPWDLLASCHPLSGPPVHSHLLSVTISFPSRLLFTPLSSSGGTRTLPPISILISASLFVSAPHSAYLWMSACRSPPCCRRSPSPILFWQARRSLWCRAVVPLNTIGLYRFTIKGNHGLWWIVYYFYSSSHHFCQVR